MQIDRIPFRSTSAFPAQVLDYLDGKEGIKTLVGPPPTLSAFEQQIQQKSQIQPQVRERLVRVLQAQYHGLEEPQKFERLLNPQCFTVCTGHQLSLMMGPLFLAYKLITTINLAKKLQAEYPGIEVVPMYWMATEDHDWEEIQGLWLGEQAFVCPAPAKGAVGRFPSAPIAAWAKQFPPALDQFKKAYEESQSLSEAVRRYIHALFGAEGLWCLDADEPSLKASFTDVMGQDLFEQKHAALVTQQNQALEQAGYQPSIQPRPIQLFYLQDQVRERIVPSEGDGFALADGSQQWTRAQMQAKLQAHPEHFSPNVLLRPLYQEAILPNLAYIGGPAELAYWMQIKPLFALHKLPFPLLMPRNAGLMLPQKIWEKWQQLGLDLSDFFISKQALKEKVLQGLGNQDWRLDQERAQMLALCQGLINKAEAQGQSLEKSAKGMQQRWEKQLKHLEHKFKKREEKRHADRLDQVQRWQSMLFPRGVLQERSQAFVERYLEDPQCLNLWMQHMDPFAFQIYFMRY